MTQLSRSEGIGIQRGPVAVRGRVQVTGQSLVTTDTASRSLAVATARMNDAINVHVVALAKANGSTTPALARFAHFNNATAKAIGLPKSNAGVVGALPTEDRAILSLVRHGVAARIPQWAARVEAEGGTKPHNRILGKAKEWADLEVKALRACGIADVIAQAEALLALEAHHG